MQSAKYSCGSLHGLRSNFYLALKVIFLWYYSWICRRIVLKPSSKGNITTSYDSEQTVDVTNEQESHQIIFGSLKIAYFVSSSQFFFR
jgi:hypothetical protein